MPFLHLRSRPEEATVFGFKTPDEMMAWAYRQMMAAQAEDGRESITLEVGDHWLRVIDFFPEVVVVFGEVADQDLPGMVSGPTYSELDPEGREAVTQVSQVLMGISEEEFEAARRAEWQLLPLMLEGHEFASRVMGLSGLEPPDVPL